MSSLNVLFVHGMWHGDWCWENFREHFRASHHVPFGQMPPFNLRNHGEPSRFTSPKAERRTPVRREGDGSQARAELELGAPVQGQTPDLKRLRWTGLGAYTADVVAAGMHVSPELSLMFDLGTNGEVVLGNADFLITCSASAGCAGRAVAS